MWGITSLINTRQDTGLALPLHQSLVALQTILHCRAHNWLPGSPIRPTRSRSSSISCRNIKKAMQRVCTRQTADNSSTAPPPPQVPSTLSNPGRTAIQTCGGFIRLIGKPMRGRRPPPPYSACNILLQTRNFISLAQSPRDGDLDFSGSKKAIDRICSLQYMSLVCHFSW